MKLIPVLTKVLTNAALDWAVAKCEGRTGNSITQDGMRGLYTPSTNWAQGGPIIDREKIDMLTTSDNNWMAEKWVYSKGGVSHHDFVYIGKTPLEATMRSYVASKFGDKFEVPSQLVSALQVDVLNKLWADLGDIPTVFEGEHVDKIEQEFLHFPVGTHRENIWRWFESMNEKFSVGEIMSGTHQAVVN